MVFWVVPKQGFIQVQRDAGCYLLSFQWGWRAEQQFLALKYFEFSFLRCKYLFNKWTCFLVHWVLVGRFIFLCPFTPFSTDRDGLYRQEGSQAVIITEKVL